MKIAILSDLHGNLEALSTALESVEQYAPDKLVCLGDVVGYGANPSECLELIRSRASVLLLGNHDAAVVGKEDLFYFNDFARAAVLWTQSVLSDENKEFIASLPLVIKERELHFVHATPKKPEAWDYIFSSYDVQDQFAAVDGKICFVGHSHVPGDYREHKAEKRFAALSKSNPAHRRIVNVGSIGQPRDRDPCLCYVLYDTDSEEVQFIREEYDVETAAGKIRSAGLPEFLADRLFWGW